MSATELVIDAAIIVVYFVGVAAVGLYMGRREHSLEDYALGGRRVPWWAVMASIIAAETSAATFMGAPAEGFATRGMTYVQLTSGLLLGRVLVGYIFLKPYYRYRVFTVYDYLAIRFGTKSKNYISALFLIMRVLASGVRLYVPSLVMVLAWRLLVRGETVQYGTLESWRPYAYAIVLLTVVTCAYTAFGGIKAVIWTDVIQATLMFASALVAVVTILVTIGRGSMVEGFHTLFAKVPEMATAKGYISTGFEKAPPGAGVGELIRRILETKYSIPAALIATTLAAMATFGTDQDMVQRMLTAADHRKSRLSLIGSAVMIVPIAGAFTFIGVLLIAFYDMNPQLMPTMTNHVFGVYILSRMPVVVRGFVLAGVFSAAMGSLSAALNALATSATNDWYIPYMARHRSGEHHVVAARFFTGVFAVLMIVIAVAFAYLNVNDPKLTILPVALGIANYILGPMLGVFLIGMCTKTRGSDAGNVVAVTAGLLTVLVTSGLFFEMLNHLAPNLKLAMPAWMPRIEFTWFAMIGSIATFLVGVLFRTPEDVLENARQKADAASAHAEAPPAAR